MSDELKPRDLLITDPALWKAWVEFLKGRFPYMVSPAEAFAAAWNRRSPTGGQEAKPDFWWNGFDDHRTGPSFRREEDDDHDIPMYAGWNPQCEIVTGLKAEIEQLRAAMKESGK